MIPKFYIDTSIWMDLYEDRTGFQGEPLGDYALKLFSIIQVKNCKLIISDILIKELEMNYSIFEINGMIKPFETNIKKIIATPKQYNKARDVAKNRKLPPGDVLHAIIARDNKLVLITRDKHFRELEDISKHYKPEDIISFC